MKFSAIIEIQGVNPYVLVSSERAKSLQANWKKPMPVTVRVNGQPLKPWHINLMPVGDGSFYLYLNGDVRKASNTKVGDKVEVEVHFDPEYKNGPMHPLPDWFNAALSKNETAQQNWNSLIPSRQKEILRYFAGLKSQEAIQRNLDRAMSALSGDPVRFMARTWKRGK